MPDLLKTGAAQEQARAAEAQRQAQLKQKRGLPFRFRIKWDLPTDAERTKEFIILDNHIDECPCFYEHTIPNRSPDAKGPDHEMCIKEWGHCPLCEKHGDSRYIQMISIIELFHTPWVDRNGVQHWKMKKVLPVTYAQQAWFRKLCVETFQGNFRGAHITTTRPYNQKSSAIGDPQVAIDPQTGMIKRYTEEQLTQFLQHPEVRSQNTGQVIKKANSDLYPYNYREIYIPSTAEALRMQYGGTAPAGSVAEAQQTFGQPAPVAAVAAPAPAALPAPAVAPAPTLAPAAAPAPVAVAQPPAAVPAAAPQPATPQPAAAPAPAAAEAPQPAAPPVAAPVAAPAPAAEPAQAAPPAPAPAPVTPGAPAPVNPAPPAGAPVTGPDLDDDIPF